MILKRFLPQPLRQWLKRLRNKILGQRSWTGLSAEKFRLWWSQYRIGAALPRDFVVMMDHYVTTTGFSGGSSRWHRLGQFHIIALAEKGIANYKQTVARHSYWGDHPIDHLLMRGLLEKSEIGESLVLPVSEVYRRHEMFSATESIQFNIATIALLDHVLSETNCRLIEEPSFGNSIFVEYNGMRISQAGLMSALEYAAIGNGQAIEPGKRFIEIGAGAGRNAYYFYKMAAPRQYVIADIMPALFLSQTSIEQAFPDKKVFKFRPFSSFAEIKDEIEAADFAFLMPDQLALLPDKWADYFLAIDCLHEMPEGPIAMYFAAADRLASMFYFKCWIEQRAETTKKPLGMQDYPVRRSWEKLFHEPCGIPSAYFHAMYRIAG